MNNLSKIFQSFSEEPQNKQQWTEKDQLKPIESTEVIAKTYQKQLANVRPMFDTAKSYFKSAYRTYLFLNPEVKLAECLVKVAYTRYPTIMRMFRIQNLSKLSRQLYFILTKYMKSILNGNMFSWEEDSGVDKARIGSKIAAITTEDRYSQQRPQQTLNVYQMHPVYRYPYYPPSIEMAALTKKRAIQRYKRQETATQLQSNVQKPNKNQHKTAMYTFPTQSTNEIGDYNMDSEARIDLSNRVIQREAEQLFDIDAMFWKSLGIEENSINRYSVAHCAKEYVSEAFKRFIKDVILS